MQPPRHFFAGANSAHGFADRFDQLLPRASIRRTFLLKGGPGVGKSTLMRRVGDALVARGEAVEYIHCGSDAESLDAIVCPAKGLLVVDGTAPHIIDPALPGAADSLIALGDALDEAGLTAHVTEIAALQADIRAEYARATRYLRAAEALRDDASETYGALLDEAAVQRLIGAWLDILTLQRAIGTPGTQRRLFASAIAPQGRVAYLDSLTRSKLWRVTGPWGAPAHAVLARLRDAALAVGYDVESYACPLSPARLEHLAVPALGLFITTEHACQAFSMPAQRTADLRAALPEALPDTQAKAVAYDEAAFEKAVAQAIVALRQAKTLHDALEALYARHMDYGAVDAAYSRILAAAE